MTTGLPQVLNQLMLYLAKIHKDCLKMQQLCQNVMELPPASDDFCGFEMFWVMPRQVCGIYNYSGKIETMIDLYDMEKVHQIVTLIAHNIYQHVVTNGA